jgi:hypothetical protein
MAAKVTNTQLSRLQKTHKTDRRTSGKSGVSRQAVHQLRKKSGGRPASTERKDRDAAIVAAYIAGETGSAIAERFGVSSSQAYRVINAANGKSKRAARKAVGKLGLSAPAKKTPGRKPGAKKAAKKTPGRKPGVKKASKKTPGRKPGPTKKTVTKKKRSRK